MASGEDFGENPDWAAGLAERKIQDAMDEGLFENLPGAGRPLDLSVNPFEPPGTGAVNRLLKHNKVLPSWLLLEKEIEASREAALAVLARWERAAPALRQTSGYEAARASARVEYEKHLQATNTLILKYNYSNPFAFRAPMPFQLKRRLREFDEQFGELS